MLTDARSPFAAWDAQWFLSIAESGYHADALVAIGGGGYYDFAFFPLWPLFIRAASLGVLPLEWTAVVAANLLWVAAMVPAHWLLRRLTPDAGAADRGLALLAFGPAAYVGSLAYSEALFVLLAAAFLLHPVNRAARPLLAVATQLTRLTGSALSLSALAGVVTRRSMTPAELATIVAGPAMLLAWIGFVWWLTGEPAGYLRGSPSWYSYSDAATGPASIVEGILAPSPYSIVSLVTVFAIAAAAVVVLRREPVAGTYAVASVLATLLLANWVNMPRHALVAIPAFAVLGEWIPAGRAGRVRLAMVAVAQVLLVTGTIRWATFPP